MYEKKLDIEVRCPLEYGLNIFCGKWKGRIICLLAGPEKYRYNALRRELGKITDAVLNSALKDLMRDGIVWRRQYNEVPPKVEYSLTAKGRSVLPILAGICQWSSQYHVAEHMPAKCSVCDNGATRTLSLVTSG